MGLSSKGASARATFSCFLGRSEPKNPVRAVGAGEALNMRGEKVLEAAVCAALPTAPCSGVSGPGLGVAVG